MSTHRIAQDLVIASYHSISVRAPTWLISHAAASGKVRVQAPGGCTPGQFVFDLQTTPENAKKLIAAPLEGEFYLDICWEFYKTSGRPGIFCPNREQDKAANNNQSERPATSSAESRKGREE